MPIILDINLSCLSGPVPPPGSDNICSILASPTVNVSGTLSNPSLQNLSGNASTDNSSRINTDSPTFEFFGKIKGNGELPSFLKHNGITFIKDNDNNQKLNNFFKKVRQWENPVSGDDRMPDPSDPVYPNLRNLRTTVYTASDGNGKIAINFLLECVSCLNPCGIGNPPDCELEIQCPPDCPTPYIMTDYTGTFTSF